jgi:DNA-binding PadR family transcriptional regulator
MAKRTASTPYAILGLLGIAPMSGYDIKKEADTSINYFWSESYGQIYPALSELQSAGFIRRRSGSQKGRERQVYEITDEGRSALDAWLAEPPRPTPVRSELLLKLFLSDASQAVRATEWVEQLLAEETERLSQFREIRSGLMAEQRDHPSLPFWLSTLSFGEHRSRAVVSWCRETLKVLPKAATTNRKEKRQ